MPTRRAGGARAALALAAALLAGCGQKGPLKLPGAPPQAAGGPAPAAPQQAASMPVRP